MQGQGQRPSLQGQGLDLEGQDLTHKDLNLVLKNP